MRLANRAGRAVLLVAGGAHDVERASGGRIGADPMEAVARSAALTELAAALREEPEPVAEEELGPCVPRPAQVFAIGLNYRDHAEEAGLPAPEQPMVFTKFPTCLVGPRADVVVWSDRVDWEAELVAVVGARTDRVPAERAREVLAGYCVGQDVSDRRIQFADRPAQFSLAKSLRSFGPIGPAVVSLDEVPAGALSITCDVDGERVQDGSTADMIFPVAELVAYLSHHCTLLPGDLIFTGTPAGVGSVRTPRRYLAAGEEIVTRIEGVGELRNRCVAHPARGSVAPPA